MIKRYLKLFPLLIVSISLGSPFTFAQEKNNVLYKWKDHEGVWHYSKIPPQDDNTNSNKIEIAKESKTIIFQEATEPVIDKAKLAELEKQKIKQKTLNCQLAGRSLLDTALALTKLNDKALQEKTITKAGYDKEKNIITKLEDIGSDSNLTNYCLADFKEHTDIKNIYDCVTDNINLDTQKACLQKYIIKE